MSKPAIHKSWSKWESSYKGGFLHTLLTHEEFKLPKEFRLDPPYGRYGTSSGLYSFEKIKLATLFLFYSLNTRSKKVKFFKSLAKEAEGIRKAYLDSNGDMVELEIPFRILEKLLVGIDSSIEPLFTHYKSALFSVTFFYRFQNSKGPYILPHLDDIVGQLKFELVDKKFENSKTFKKLVAETKFVNIENSQTLFKEDARLYKNLQSKIAKHLVDILDITFEPKESTVHMLRHGKLDTKRLPQAIGGDPFIYKKQFEDFEVKPFKVVMLADFSGSMDYNFLLFQEFLMGAYFKAFSEIMPETDIRVYGHSGNTSPEIYTLHDPSSDILFKDTVGQYPSLLQNYDGPVLESLFSKVLSSLGERILLLYFSDGTPEGHMYGGEAARKDLFTVAEKLKRSDVLVVGVGLGQRDMSDLYQYSTIISTDEIHGLLASKFEKVETMDIARSCHAINRAVKDVFT